MQHEQMVSPFDRGRDTRQRPYWRNMALLFILYYSQGVIAGLVGGTFPVVLRERLSYGENGLFSIALYPYSLKVLWGPLIDAMRNPHLGHRKGWIVPALLISGSGLLMLGLNASWFMEIMYSANAGVVLVVTILLVVVFASATQGAAADGWALGLFSRDHAHHVSVTHHMGMVLGEFFSYSVFLWVASLKSGGPSQGVTREGINRLLSSFVIFSALIILGLALPCVLSTPEVTFLSQEQQTMSVKIAYKKTLNLFRLKPLLMTTLVHLLSQISFEAHDAATNLKLLDQGFGEANLAIVSTIDLLVDILSSYTTKVLCVRMPPLELWCWAFVGRTIAVILAQLIIAFNSDHHSADHPWMFVLVVLEHACSTSTATIMFVAFLTFHLQISDPAFGSTYLTLLATAQNMGKTIPRSLVMFLIDFTTTRSCGPILVPGGFAAKGAQQTCQVNVDGYHVVNIVCVVAGTILFVLFIRPTVLFLQKVPLGEWRLMNSTGSPHGHDLEYRQG